MLEAKARALAKETGMDFADAFAQIKVSSALFRGKKRARKSSVPKSGCDSGGQK